MSTNLPRHDARALGYISGVAFLGAGLIGLSLHHLTVEPSTTSLTIWAAFAILTLLAGGLSLRLPVPGCIISFSDALIFLSVFLFGPELATLTGALDGYASSTRNGGGLEKRLFNTAGMALSVGLSARLFRWIEARAVDRPSMERLLVATIALAAAQLILNTALVAIVVALKEGTAPAAMLRSSFGWSAVSMFAGSLTAAAVYMAIDRVGATTCLAILPVPAVLHLLYRAALYRVRAVARSSRG